MAANKENDQVEKMTFVDETESKDVSVKKTKTDFLNPFEQGVTYAEFIEALGKQSVANYCKGKLTDEEINFIETELSLIKKEK